LPVESTKDLKIGNVSIQLGTQLESEIDDETRRLSSRAGYAMRIP